MNQIQVDKELKVLLAAMKIARDNDSKELIEALKKEIANYESYIDDLSNE